MYFIGVANTGVGDKTFHDRTNETKGIATTSGNPGWGYCVFSANSDRQGVSNSSYLEKFQVDAKLLLEPYSSLNLVATLMLASIMIIY